MPEPRWRALVWEHRPDLRFIGSCGDYDIWHELKYGDILRIVSGKLRSDGWWTVYSYDREACCLIPQDLDVVLTTSEAELVHRYAMLFCPEYAAAVSQAASKEMA